MITFMMQAKLIIGLTYNFIGQRPSNKLSFCH